MANIEQIHFDIQNALADPIVNATDNGKRYTYQIRNAVINRVITDIVQSLFKAGEWGELADFFRDLSVLSVIDMPDGWIGPIHAYYISTVLEPIDVFYNELDYPFSQRPYILIDLSQRKIYARLNGSTILHLVAVVLPYYSVGGVVDIPNSFFQKYRGRILELSLQELAKIDAFNL